MKRRNPRHRAGTVRTETPFYPVEGDLASVVRVHVDRAKNALDFWKKVSDVGRIKVPSGSSYVDMTLRREAGVARRIARVANAFQKSPKAGQEAWMKNATAVQDFFAYRSMDKHGFTDPATQALHNAWSRVTDGALRATMDAR
jgi:hypothetical protein